MYAMAATLYLGFINVVVAQTRGHSPFPQMKKPSFGQSYQTSKDIGTEPKRSRTKSTPSNSGFEDMEYWIPKDKPQTHQDSFYTFLYAFTMNNQVSALKEKSSIKEILKSQEFKQLMSKLEQYLNKNNIDVLTFRSQPKWNGTKYEETNFLEALVSETDSTRAAMTLTLTTLKYLENKRRHYAIVSLMNGINSKNETLGHLIARRKISRPETAFHVLQGLIYLMEKYELNLAQKDHENKKAFERLLENEGLQKIAYHAPSNYIVPFDYATFEPGTMESKELNNIIRYAFRLMILYPLIKAQSDQLNRHPSLLFKRVAENFQTFSSKEVLITKNQERPFTWFDILNVNPEQAKLNILGEAVEILTEKGIAFAEDKIEKLETSLDKINRVTLEKFPDLIFYRKSLQKISLCKSNFN